jgi:hypothetical protein
VGGGCTLAVIPSLPAGLPNRAGPARVYAARRVTMGAGGEWASIGFDRDGICTVAGPGAMSSCRPALAPIADGTNGRDNTFGAVIGSVGILGTSFDEMRLNRSIGEGNGTLGLRLRDYGGADDGAITVEVLPLVDGHANGSARTPPTWDGRDQGSVDRNLAYGADRTTPRITTSEGFSSCGTIVMPFANTAPLYFANDVSRSQLTLTDMRIVGTIDASGNLTTSDLSAVWARTQVFEDLRSFGACQELLSPGDWTTLQLGVTAALDLLATGGVNPNAECSAMSMAFRIEWVPIIVEGDVSPPPPVVTDPCTVNRDAGTRG